MITKLKVARIITFIHVLYGHTMSYLSCANSTVRSDDISNWTGADTVRGGGRHSFPHPGCFCNRCTRVELSFIDLVLRKRRRTCMSPLGFPQDHIQLVVIVL